MQHLPFYDSAALLSSQFSNYFVDKIKNIRKKLDNCHVLPLDKFHDNSSEGVTMLEVLRPVSQDELLKVYHKISK